MMRRTEKLICSKRKAVVLIIAMIFILVFSTFALSMAAMSGSSVEVSSNQHEINSALSAAQSGLECGKYIIAQTSHTLAGMPAMNTGLNYVTQTQANTVWTTLCSQVQSQPWVAGRAAQTANEINTPDISFGQANASFQVRFYRDDTNSIQIEGIGVDGQVKRQVSINSEITKDNQVLNYAVASVCRMWLTGNSTVHGNIYSAWQYQNISPFNITSDSTVEGTINTILSNINPNTGETGPDLYADKFDSHGNPVLDANGNCVEIKMPYDLETLDANGNPEYDPSGNKVISPTDEIQGQCEGINYDVNYGDKAIDMPGMNIADYNTSSYKAQTTAPADDKTVYNYQKDSHGNYLKDRYGNYIPATVTEYFPNAVDKSGNPIYSQPSSSGSLKLTRYVCQNKTLTNLRVVANKNALFQNCTFNGILYVDNASGSNDVRFENCIFNGPIVTTTSTDTSSGWWQRNQLYFTGTETFQNQTTVQATILAPNFNVNIGNTDPTESDNNVLTGAIVGGIVDIRGTAQVYGTVISMFDTSGYSSGYVSNIGATTKDGGSETVAVGDVGTIDITPAPDKLLPSGVMSLIVVRPSQDTYSEEITVE